MNSLNEPLLMEYDSEIGKYKELEPLVIYALTDELKNAGIGTMQIAHRIKTRDSFAEKLLRKPDKYASIYDMTDILGIRIICYFSDQVDEIAAILRRIFVVDDKDSVDKRKNLDPATFGYLSLHYICSLPQKEDHSKGLSEIRFEIQVRTVLQHTWAEIEHDLGYKTDFGIPKAIRRNFARVAGLLEIADEAFLQIRNTIVNYEKDVRDRIINDNVDDMPLDLVSLKAYLEFSPRMNELIKEIAAISGANVVHISPENYLVKLDYFGITNLGELNAFVCNGYDDALFFAKRTLEKIQLDEVSSVIGLYYLCRAQLVLGDYDKDRLMEYYLKGEATGKIAEMKTNRILKLRDSIKSNK